MARAISHPLRAKLFTRLNERVASPNELARELGEPLGNVSYHVRTLLELDCIELVETRPRRGAVEHFYRATRRAMLGDAAWQQLAPPARRGLLVHWFQEVFRDITAAIDSGRMEQRRDLHLTHTRLVLDEDAWAELADQLEEVLARALELEAESVARLQEGGPGITARLVLAQYEGAQGGRKRRTS
jgi:DNA-binding transcriptional ArsR family regulator